MIAKRRDYYSLILQRSIVDRCKTENRLNSNLAGKINRSASILSVKLFDKMRGRKLWIKVCWNRGAWLNKRRANFDQIDLMIAARRAAKRIVARRRIY